MDGETGVPKGRTSLSPGRLPTSSLWDGERCDSRLDQASTLHTGFFLTLLISSVLLSVVTLGVVVGYTGRPSDTGHEVTFGNGAT